MTVTLRWADWNTDPAIIAGVLLTGLGYLWLLQRFPARGRQPVYFWAGFLSLAAALLSPLHRGAGYLFTLHMVQHMLLLLVAPPLLVLGTPPTVIGWVYRRPFLRRLYKVFVSPVPATFLYNGVLLLWHLPAAYDATLRDPLIHGAEHLSFLVVGVLFWGVIVSPSPRLSNASIGVRLVMIVAADLVNFMLGFVLAFADRPRYAPYTTVPRLWGLSPLEDLKLGGALMWVMGQMMYLIPLLILLYWFLWRREGRTGSLTPSPSSGDA